MTTIEGLIDLSTALHTDIASFFIDLRECSPDSLENPQLRSLFYQLSLLDKKQQGYIAKQIELFLSFSNS